MKRFNKSVFGRLEPVVDVKLQIILELQIPINENYNALQMKYICLDGQFYCKARGVWKYVRSEALTRVMKASDIRELLGETA